MRYSTEIEEAIRILQTAGFVVFHKKAEVHICVQQVAPEIAPDRVVLSRLQDELAHFLSDTDAVDVSVFNFTDPDPLPYLSPGYRALRADLRYFPKDRKEWQR